MRRAIEAIWNRQELDVADELFAADYVNHRGLIPDLVRGPEAIKFSVALYRLAFPGLYITVEELGTKGAAVVLRWSARRRRPGGPCANGPTAREELLTGITRSRVAGGKIQESWTDWEPR